MKAKGHPYRKEIAQSLLLAVFHEVYGMFKNHMPIEVKKSRQEELFAAFIQTLALHHKQERSVAFYAGKLCVTPKYLSLLVKNVSNRTAGEWTIITLSWRRRRYYPPPPFPSKRYQTG